MTITRQQLADAVRAHLGVDPSVTSSVEIDEKWTMQATPTQVALSREQAVGFLDAIGIDPDRVVWVKADANTVRLFRQSVVGGEPSYEDEVIDVEDAR